MTRTLNISIDVPQGYEVERLERQLTEYALVLLSRATASPEKKHRKHHALCGIIRPEERANEYVDGYLRDKYER